ncbi:MAG: aconitate hydratase, partial [Rhodothermales bacterium]|nr:aconitate hydratase [Rhodothermales bacterium]
EVLDTINANVRPEMYAELYDGIEESNPKWNEMPISGGALYEWKEESTYIQEPPFFMDVTAEIPEIEPIHDARLLAKLGDSTTTDHISPAGAIPKDEPAGRYLPEHGVEPK